MKLLQKIEKVWSERLEKAVRKKASEKPFMPLPSLNGIEADTSYGNHIREIMRDIKRKSFRVSPEDQDKIIKSRNMWLILALSRRGDTDKGLINEALSNTKGFGRRTPFLSPIEGKSMGGNQKHADAKKEMYTNFVNQLIEKHGESRASVIDKYLHGPSHDLQRFIARDVLNPEELLNHLSNREKPLQRGAMKGVMKNPAFGQEHKDEILGHGSPENVKALIEQGNLSANQYSLLFHNPNSEVRDAAIRQVAESYGSSKPNLPAADIVKAMREHPDKHIQAELYDRYAKNHPEVRALGQQMMPENADIAKKMLHYHHSDHFTPETVTSVLQHHGKNDEVLQQLAHRSQEMPVDQVRSIIHDPEISEHTRSQFLDNPELTPADLAPFSQSDSIESVRKALEHPNADPTIIQNAFNKARAKAGSETDSTWEARRWREIQDSSLAHPKAPAELQGNIALMSAASQEVAAKKSKNLTPEMMKILATSPHVEVRATMALRPDLPEEWQKALRADKQVTVRKAYFKSKAHTGSETPEDWMAQVKDKASTVRENALKNSRITPEAVKFAWAHKDAGTRLLALKSRNAPAEIAEQASRDPDLKVREAAWSTGKLSPEAAQSVYDQSPTDSDRQRFIGLSNPSRRGRSTFDFKLPLPSGVVDDAIARGFHSDLAENAIQSLNAEQVSRVYQGLKGDTSGYNGRRMSDLITKAKEVKPELLDQIIAHHNEPTPPWNAAQLNQPRKEDTSAPLWAVLGRPELNDENLNRVAATPNPRETLGHQEWSALVHNPKSAHLPQVLSMIQGNSDAYGKFIQGNSEVNESHLRHAWASPSAYIRHQVVQHDKVPLDIIHQAMRDPEPTIAKKAQEQVALHDPDEYNKILPDAHTVDVNPAVEKLKHLKGQIESLPERSVHKRDLKTKLGVQEVPSQILDAKGSITPESIDNFIKTMPKMRYNISYRQWHGAQQHDSTNPQLVLQMNLTNEQVAHLKDKGLYDTFRKVHNMSFRSGHPVQKHTLGWSRIDTAHPGHIHIDEVQSDLGQGTIRQILAAKENGQMQGDEADKYVKDLKEINKYLAGGHKTINHAILSAVHQTARERGVPGITEGRSVVPSGHTMYAQAGVIDPAKVPAQKEIKSTSMDLLNDQAAQSGQQQHEGAKPLPIHMQQTYKELPEAMGYEVKPKKEVMPATNSSEASVNYRKLTKSLTTAKAALEFLKKSGGFTGGWASSRPDRPKDATSMLPNPRKATSPKQHVRADTMTHMNYDTAEEHAPKALKKASEPPPPPPPPSPDDFVLATQPVPICGTNARPLAKADAAQYQVDLGVPKAKEAKGKYAQWHVSKDQLAHILKNWHNVQWEQRSLSRPSAEGKFHSTAITRNKLSLPIAHYLETNGKPAGRTLYHGVGRDDVGAQALGAERYDPFHPDPKVQQQPKGKFDEVHSHYTLNVVDKDTGHKILSHIHSLLGPKGKAVISVRRDLAPPTQPTKPTLKKSDFNSKVKISGSLRKLLEAAKKVTGHAGEQQPRDEQGRFEAWDEAAAAAHEKEPDDYDAYADEAIWGKPDPKLQKASPSLSTLAQEIKAQNEGQIARGGHQMNTRFPANAKAVNLFASYKQNPHNPVASVLKYAIHRIENKDKYKTPEGAQAADQQFLNDRNRSWTLARLPGHKRENQHSIEELHNIMVKAPHIVDDLIHHQNQLHAHLKGASKVKNIDNEPHVGLVRGLGTGQRLPDPVTTSYSDTHEQTLGGRITKMHNHWVPLKNVWYSYDHGPKEAHPSHYFPAQDEFLVSPHPLKTALSTDIKKLVPRKPKEPTPPQPAQQRSAS